MILLCNDFLFYFFIFFIYNQSKKHIYNITIRTNTPIQYGIYCQNVYNYIHLHKHIHAYIYIHIHIPTQIHQYNMVYIVTQYIPHTYIYIYIYIYTLHLCTPHLYFSNSFIHFTLLIFKFTNLGICQVMFYKRY